MLNQITIQGRLTKDVEIKLSSGGVKYSMFCVAVQRNYRNKSGKYDTDFFDCIASEKTAEHICKYYHKGSEIILTGELQSREYEDQNGQKHKNIFISVAKTYFLSSKSENTKQANEPVEVMAATSEEPNELPFEQ